MQRKSLKPTGRNMQIDFAKFAESTFTVTHSQFGAMTVNPDVLGEDVLRRLKVEYLGANGKMAQREHAKWLLESKGRDPKFREALLDLICANYPSFLASLADKEVVKVDAEDGQNERHRRTDSASPDVPAESLEEVLKKQKKNPKRAPSQGNAKQRATEVSQKRNNDRH